MNTESKALRLADLIDHGSTSTQIERETAAELRRLHSVNAELLDALNALVTAHGSILGLRESDELKLARLAITEAQE
jgi:hypothetical protein